MNKKILFYSAVLISGSLLGQPVPNGNFEAWKADSMYMMPNITPATIKSMSSNDDIFFRYGITNVTKVAGKAGSAIRLESIEIQRTPTEKDTSGAYYVIGGQPGSGMVFPGGFPFTDSAMKNIEGYFRYDVDVSSPALVVVQFKKAGVALGAGNLAPGIYAFTLSGTQNTFTKSTFPIFPRLNDIPDTVVIGFTSNNMLDDPSIIIPGNFIEVDSIRFTGTTQKIPEGTFDNWKKMPPVNLPEKWNVPYVRSDENIKSTNPLDGSAAVKLTKINDRGSSISLGITEHDNYNKSYYYPEMKVNSNPKSIFFSYKFTSTGVDTAQMSVDLTRWDAAGDTNIRVGGAWAQLLKTTGWKTVHIPVNIWGMGEQADSAIIRFESGNWNVKTETSELWIDNVYFNYCDDTLKITGDSSVCSNKKTGNKYSVPFTDSSTYTWKVPGGATIVGKSDTNAIVVNFADSIGTIEVIKTYIDGCNADTAMLNIKFKKCTSDTKGISTPVTFYPNPATGQITFSCDVESVIISDLTGKIVLAKEIKGSVLTLGNIQSGLYLIQIKTGDGSNTLKLVIE